MHLKHRSPGTETEDRGRVGKRPAASLLYQNVHTFTSSLPRLRGPQIVICFVASLALPSCVVTSSIAPVRQSAVYRHGQMLFATTPTPAPRSLSPRERATIENDLAGMISRLGAARRLDQAFAAAAGISRRDSISLRVHLVSSPSAGPVDGINIAEDDLRTTYLNAFGDLNDIANYFARVRSYRRRVVNVLSMNDDAPIFEDMDISAATESRDRTYRTSATFVLARRMFDHSFICPVGAQCDALRDAYALIVTHTLLPGSTLGRSFENTLSSTDHEVLECELSSEQRKLARNDGARRALYERITLLIAGPLHALLE